MEGHGDIPKESAYRTQNGNSPLTETVVYDVVCQARNKVANKRDDEEGGDNGIVDFIIWLYLSLTSVGGSKGVARGCLR